MNYLEFFILWCFVTAIIGCLLNGIEYLFRRENEITKLNRLNRGLVFPIVLIALGGIANAVKSIIT